MGVGSLKPEKMITSRIPLENLVEGGIKRLINEKDRQVKVLVEIQAKRDSAIHLNRTS